MGKQRLVQHHNQIGYWKGSGSKKEFAVLTNFGMTFLKFVESPPQLPEFKGFVVEVRQGHKKNIQAG